MVDVIPYFEKKSLGDVGLIFSNNRSLDDTVLDWFSCYSRKSATLISTGFVNCAWDTPRRKHATRAGRQADRLDACRHFLVFLMRIMWILVTRLFGIDRFCSSRLLKIRATNNTCPYARLTTQAPAGQSVVSYGYEYDSNNLCLFLSEGLFGKSSVSLFNLHTDRSLLQYFTWNSPFLPLETGKNYKDETNWLKHACDQVNDGLVGNNYACMTERWC
jgi:hypothetical protein